VFVLADLTTSEWIDVAVAAGTAALAVATAAMAIATRRMAKGAEDQLQELRRQSDAAEAGIEQTERTIGATQLPVLRVMRYTGDEAVVTADEEEWSVMVQNVGPVVATVLAAKLNLAPQPILLDAVPGNPIKPEGQVLLRGAASRDALELLLNGTPVELLMEYEGPGASRRRVTRVTLRAKDRGDRWLITDRERNKP
jgi:hypothetical protein